MQGAALLDDEEATVEELELPVLPEVDVLPDAGLDPALVPPPELAFALDPSEFDPFERVPVDPPVDPLVAPPAVDPVSEPPALAAFGPPSPEETAAEPPPLDPTSSALEKSLKPRTSAHAGAQSAAAINVHSDFVETRSIRKPREKGVAHLDRAKAGQSARRPTFDRVTPDTPYAIRRSAQPVQSVSIRFFLRPAADIRDLRRGRDAGRGRRPPQAISRRALSPLRRDHYDDRRRAGRAAYADPAPPSRGVGSATTGGFGGPRMSAITVSPSGPCLHSTLNDRRPRSRAS